jgi:ubiquinone/menaquinone biosynthesis C-methylase UbiE
MPPEPPDPKGSASAALVQEVKAIWDANARFWDAHMGETGNDFHRVLVVPATERLLQIRPDEEVLEIACGSGLLARRLAELGARVLCTDVSEVFLERARERTREVADRLDFRNLDATDETSLRALGDNRFDAAVAGMALMDIPTIEPLYAALARVLRPGGRFVFTVCHPCFNNSSTVRMAEEEDREGAVTVTHAVKVSRYLRLEPILGCGVQGQPRPHYYFHRSIGDLLNAGFRHGFVLDGLEEPAFPAGTATRSLDLRNFSEIPMVLAARMRLPADVSR